LGSAFVFFAISGVVKICLVSLEKENGWLKKQGFIGCDVDLLLMFVKRFV
jgi:hypothetical protein